MRDPLSSPRRLLRGLVTIQSSNTAHRAPETPQTIVIPPDTVRGTYPFHWERREVKEVKKGRGHWQMGCHGVD